MDRFAVPAVALAGLIYRERTLPFQASLRASVVIPGDTEIPGSAEKPELMVMDDAPGLVTSRAFAEAVVAKIGAGVTAGQVQADLSSSRYSRLLSITATDGDANKVKTIAGAAGDVLPAMVNQYLVADPAKPAAVQTIDPVSEPTRSRANAKLLIAAVPASRLSPEHFSRSSSKLPLAYAGNRRRAERKSRILWRTTSRVTSGATATNPYPNADDLKDLGTVHEMLASQGVGSIMTGFDMTELAAAVYARGWTYSIDRTGSDFRATVAQPGGDRDQFRAVGSGGRWKLRSRLRSPKPLPSSSVLSNRQPASVPASVCAMERGSFEPLEVLRERLPRSCGLLVSSAGTPGYWTILPFLYSTSRTCCSGS